MREIMLVCNAHLDIIWLWKWEEGAAEAVSTYRTAAEFCRQYDGFVFNHNESILYEWIEEYEPELFREIQALVKCGKWKIMGGWYLQPDCLMLSGESFIRQISYGRKFFKEKFDAEPKTAVNFDSFGHTRGLVQILKKTGFTNYVFMRPYRFIGDFVWKGFDGSEIIAHGLYGAYNSNLGTAVSNIKGLINKYPDVDPLFVAWGIGDHGGGPSRIDYEGICAYQEAHPEYRFTHSYCEEYFDKVNTSELQTFEKSLVHCMVGGYSSMIRIKQANRRVENKLELCKRMLAHAKIDLDQELLEKAERALMMSQFHDVVPGTLIQSAEEDALKKFDFAEEICDQYMLKAFFVLCAGQPKGKSGEIPVLVYNPLPYTIEREIEVEFQLENQNWNDGEVTIAKVRTQKGEYISCQNEKEECTFSLDWRKKVVFRAMLSPMSINRFDCELEVKKNYSILQKPVQTEVYLIVETARLLVKINKQTGLIDEFKVDGKSRLKEASGKIRAFQDNEDPWAMRVRQFDKEIGDFKLMSDQDATAFCGYPDEKISNVHVIENGDVRMKMQAIFELGRSVAVVVYTIPKQDAYIDIDITMYSNDVNRLYKLVFDTAVSDAKFIGQTAFGTEELEQNNQEVAFHKWCGVENQENSFYVINNGTYAGSMMNQEMRLTLLRTPVHAAHPINDRVLAPHDRMHSHGDMGMRSFRYRLTAASEIDAEAESFNMPPYVLSFFPSGMGTKCSNIFEIDNKHIILSTLQRNLDTTLFRIFNASQETQKAHFSIEEISSEVLMDAFEVKTFVYRDKVLIETDMLGNIPQGD